MVSACKGVVEHRGKLWGELTEGEGNIVATRVGVIAHEIIRTSNRRKRDTPCIDPRRVSKRLKRLLTTHCCRSSSGQADVRGLC